MNYRLITSKRKTISLSFDENVRLVVRAPAFLDIKTIEDFINSKQDWIERTSTRLKIQKGKVFEENPKLVNGDLLPYLGTMRVLSLIEEAGPIVKVSATPSKIIMQIPLGADYEQKRAGLEKWYREEAKKLLEQKARDFAFTAGAGYKLVKVRDQKSCWGSCTQRGNLNFNWRIIMAPEKVIDYLVVHEVCHLIYMNHSKEYWGMVAKLCPDYKSGKQWLKANGYTLYCI